MIASESMADKSESFVGSRTTKAGYLVNCK
jgi:hypothetical protein